MVAANTSILLAFVTIGSIREKRAVNNMIAVSLVPGLSKKYRTKIEAHGSMDERSVLKALIMVNMES